MWCSKFNKRWVKLALCFTFNLADAGTNGTGSMATLTKDAGSSYTLPANKFTANQYYEFSGWSVNGGSTQAAGTSITITGNTTITAVWSKITYTVSFVANGKLHAVYSKQYIRNSNNRRFRYRFISTDINKDREYSMESNKGRQ